MPTTPEPRPAPAPVPAGTAVTVVDALRAGWGAVLLVVPGRAWRLFGVRDPGEAALALTRVLGVRHLVQAALQTAGPAIWSGPAVGAGFDVLHAASDLAFALSPRHRRAVLADSAVALGFAAAGWAAHSRKEHR